MEILKPENYAEFEQFNRNHPRGHFMQSAEWAALKNDWKREVVVTRNGDGSIRGGISILVRKIPMTPYTLMYAPRGPIFDEDDSAAFADIVNGARSLAKRHRSVCLRMDPDIRADYEPFKKALESMKLKVKGGKNFETTQPRFVYRMDIKGKTEDEVMANFTSKTRYNVRVAIKNGVETRVVNGDPEAIAQFHALMTVTGERDGFICRSKEYFERLLKSLGEDARLYAAYYNGEMIAGTLAIRYADKVWYLYGASSNKERNRMPNYLLQWDMIRWAIESGVSVYDFRGVSGDMDESNPLYGLYRFKRGFNGELVEFVGEIDAVFKRFGYTFTEFGTRTFKHMRKRRFLAKTKDKRHHVPAPQHKEAKTDGEAEKAE
ncbi:MAG: peptidoglycan bridge formation glycyltransferase FemA/FemB family protein [Clostridia bacterium]|nr:peptidoglycan bridge formation glycyltransferase FemA/FemB family protein [Clostridia bacterium]